MGTFGRLGGDGKDVRSKGGRWDDGGREIREDTTSVCDGLFGMNEYSCLLFVCGVILS
jgi:hypothetical protein